MRRSVLGVILLATVAVFVTAIVTAPAAEAGTKVRLTSKERAIVRLVNKERRDRGLKPLKVRKSLTKAARLHSRDMARKRYFSHYSRNGRTPAQRMRRCGYSRTRCRSWRVGENIAWATPGLATAKATVAAWMDSPSHRRIILLKCFRDVGVGTARGAIKRGSTTLKNVTFFTIDLGRRRR